MVLVSHTLVPGKDTELDPKKHVYTMDIYSSMNGDSTKIQCKIFCSQEYCRSNTVSNSLGTDTNGVAVKQTENNDLAKSVSHPVMNGQLYATQVASEPIHRFPERAAARYSSGLPDERFGSASNVVAEEPQRDSSQ